MVQERPLPLRPMGYQPVLDGIRAVAVVAVILYHAGFDWMHGGFFGVEVFFVVSGYLITSLLIDEHRRDGRVSLRAFWIRRARRLLPALFTMLVAVSLWASFFAEEHLAQLRRDILPAAFYISNWAQVVGDVPYFSTEDPVLRHVWSLAVEEQWYLLWPLVFAVVVALVKGRLGHPRLPLGLAAASLASMLLSAALTISDGPTVSFLAQDAQRYNFLYLNTISRASGLLLGASMAFWWRPWTRRRRAARPPSGLTWADLAGITALAAVVVIAMASADDVLTSPSLYRLWLPVVTVLSAIAVGAMVDPDAGLARRMFGSRAIVEIGKRSYGLYLWHWPVFVFADVRSDHSRFVPAIVVAVVVAEVCYRYVETPVRTGALSRWWQQVGAHVGRERRTGIAGLYLFSAVVLTGTLGARLVTAETVDVARDDRDVAFDDTAFAAAPSPTVTQSGVPVAVVPATPTTLPTPRRVVIVGDSQAHSLAVNLPSGIGTTFDISDGSVEGCGVLDTGRVLSARSSFRRTLSDCAGWHEQWADAAAESSAQLALVVIGAWDVFDVEVGGATVRFGSPQGDALLLDGLRRGIDALAAEGTHAALLEVACMRPQDVEGAGVPALPERGDDARIAHLNTLLRRAAAADPVRATFIEGPEEWCSDPEIASDVGYRWDGVHVYKPGAKLIYETIAASLLAIPV